MSNYEKRLSIDIDNITHSHIKKICVDKDISMREWVVEAIKEKILKDADLGYKYKE